MKSCNDVKTEYATATGRVHASTSRKRASPEWAETRSGSVERSEIARGRRRRCAQIKLLQPETPDKLQRRRLPLLKRLVDNHNADRNK
jgi:hypothetical protein